ncbi:hypothetical protein [Paracoccus spongiarum]|uniref:Sulfotransferase family protein n=1 Tax=Paracoccus spongiarum TaxID=3064387 RepID=A0ABT9JEB9_9RHOB|nr:hypothetical protein [Paracoccus sp. 2205BS29-5]MDP5307411.1 hypothetical protein [Paracoccus sp. 2205BS29-5]
MKVILYIGHHKVGSTALQTFLSWNWLKLLRDGGILYPMVEAEGLGNCLRRAMTGKDDHGRLSLNQREPHNTLAFRMIDEVGGFKLPAFLDRPPSSLQMMRAIREQVENLTPSTVIMCSEVMSNFGHVGPQLTRRIRDLFPGAEFEIYLTLRRPDEYLASWHGQRFRFGYKLDRLEGAVAKRYATSVHFDYKTLLLPWQETFPDARFHIRNYRDVLAAGGSCEDFIRQVGVRFPSGLAAAPRSNQSIPYAFYEIARRANQTLEGPLPGQMMNFLERTSASRDVPANSEVEVLGAEARAHLSDRFQPIHAYLGKVADQSPFFPDIDELGRVRPVPELDAARAALARLRSLPPWSRPSAPLWQFLKELEI